MKKKNSILNLILGGALILSSASVFTSCGKEEEEEVVDNSTTTRDGVTYRLLVGEITSDLTLDADTKYLLSGGVFVKDGATLTVPAGMTVYADNVGTAFLSIERGGKIMAVGTSDNPIVFTSINSLDGSAERGEWGGLVINGKASNNVGNDVQGEGGSGLYGGSDDADNSGKLKYVRCEYAGAILGTDNEMNTFSFNAVGSGTEISYIQAYMGQDDGIEFFGGTVDVDYAVSSGSRDDSFDWTQGWRGNGTNWIVEQASDEGDRGIEADNNSQNNNAAPISSPTLSKVTIYSNGGSDGILLRVGTEASLTDVLVDGSDDGIEIDGDVSIQNYIDGEITLTNVTFTNMVGLDLNFDTDDATLETNAQGVTFVAGDGTGADNFNTGAWYKELPDDIQL